MSKLGDLSQFYKEYQSTDSSDPSIDDTKPGPYLRTRTVELCNTEDLRQATHGADLKVVQLAPGPFEGRLTHVQVGAIHVSAGEFCPDVRARGVMNPDLVTIGMMIDNDGEVKQWDHDIIPGDIVLFPKGIEQEGRFTGRSSYVTLTLSEQELAFHAVGEGVLQDPKFWTCIRWFRCSPVMRSFIRTEVAERLNHLRTGQIPNSSAAIDYLQRALLEIFLMGILDSQSQFHEQQSKRRSSQIIKAVEDYVDGITHHHTLHISELCSSLHVSRRTLHRAFHDLLGHGPLEYLRLRRLANVRRKLMQTQCPLPRSVTQIALEEGFYDLGRFSQSYRRMFGETPSHTRRRIQIQSAGNRLSIQKTNYTRIF